jgi:hypothetical protein
MPSCSRPAWFAIVTAAGLATVTNPAAAQQGDRSWRPTVRVQAEVRYDDNPFLLTPNQKGKLQTVSAADAVSGRFRDMTGPTDVIPVAGARVAAAGPGLGGRTLELSADVAYDVNVENARRRHAELTVGVEQSLPKAGRLRLRADWRPSYFSKNYLSDASDASGDGNITPDERVYSAGTSHEIDLTLGYRHRLVKSRQSSPVGVMGELELGYFARGYDAPFAGRDRRGPGMAAGVAVELNPRWTVGLHYGFQALHADPTREVLILDETAFGVDFNGTNGVADTAARAFEMVDRSRTEQELRASVETELSGGVTLQLAYARRIRNFSSSEPYDVSDRDRHDARNELEAELTVRLAHGMRLMLGGVAVQQSTNRPGDPGSTGDVADYSRHVVTAGVGYRF